MRLTTTLAVTTATISTMVFAQTERDLDSHEHGSASLNIALDDSAIYLELETPWDNLVGFEHAPRTPEQHSQVDDALALLNDPMQLFSFDGTKCVLSETVLENSLAEGDDEHGEDHDDKDKDHHDADHDDKDEDHHDADHDDKDEDHHDADHDDKDEDHHDADHDDKDEDHHDADHDEHAGHDDEESTHSAVLVSYSFECSELSKLSSIDVKLLEIWTGFEDLDVQLIGPGGQASVELNPEQIRVETKQVQ